MSAEFHDQSIAQVQKELKTTAAGLSASEVEKRFLEYGPNTLRGSGEGERKSTIFFNQWKSPLLLILLVAGTVSGFLGEFSDMAIIYVTASINAMIGFFQEAKASTALSALQQMVTYTAVVIRDGRHQSIESSQLVPGDVLILSAGDKIQADGRLIEAVRLEINEAALTGESMPTIKHTKPVPAGAVLADRLNMIYRGTHIVNGRGLAVVTAIGMKTEVGKIATLVEQAVEEKTPLQIQLTRLGKYIGYTVVGIAIAIIGIGLFGNKQEYELLELVQTAVAVAVAAIPEGLVISLTVILAIGMQQILKRRALVRRLLAAETLGSVNVICTDKTGTLTEGKMQVTRMVTSAENLDFSELQELSTTAAVPRHQDLLLALQIGVLCNDVMCEDANEEKKDTPIGDTTEIALALLGLKVGLLRQELESKMPRVGEIPFQSETKCMTTIHAVGKKKIVYVKGAPEILLSRSTQYEMHGEARDIDEKQRVWFRTEEDTMARQGLRVLAVAYTLLEDDTVWKEVVNGQESIGDLVFVGLIGMSDPLRPDVLSTMRQAFSAGIRVYMITGDHLRTAEAIGRELQLITAPGQAMDGAHLEELSERELQQVLEQVRVFARVSPHHKIRIVRALQASGNVVAMTGDGVNDAPALKGADIGVAVGSGTDVAKETADLVLLDDSFSTIVAAVEEGRRMYQNIKKVMLYLFMGSMAEVSLIVGCIFLGLPLALLPAQILWINVIQESFPTIALAFDPGDPRNMSTPPRQKGAPLFDRLMTSSIMAFTLVTNAILFTLFWYLVRGVGNLAFARTVVFAGLGVISLFSIYAVRSSSRHVWQMNPFDNAYLTGAVTFGWAMLLSAIYIPFLQTALHTVPLSGQAWLFLIFIGMMSTLLVEAVKTLFFTTTNQQFIHE